MIKVTEHWQADQKRGRTESSNSGAVIKGLVGESMMKYTYEGTLKSGEAFFTDAAGNILIEKDHSCLADATPEEAEEAVLKMVNVSIEINLIQ